MICHVFCRDLAHGPFCLRIFLLHLFATYKFRSFIFLAEIRPYEDGSQNMTFPRKLQRASWRIRVYHDLTQGQSFASMKVPFLCHID